MTTWLFINSLGLTAVAFVLYLTLRQLGYVLNRVTPLGARGTSDGPRIGENLAPQLPFMFRGDERSKALLILFGADACAICAQIKIDAHALAKSWRTEADIVLIYDCLPETDGSPVEELVKGLFFKRECELRRRCGASFVPFGIVTDRTGTVVGKGLVNEIGHLESLLELERKERTTTRTEAEKGVPVHEHGI